MTEIPASFTTRDADTVAHVAPQPAKPLLRDTLRGANGYDEIAVEQRFGAELGELGGTKIVRAAAFLLERKRGHDDATAYGRCMSATLAELEDTFADAEDDEPQAAGDLDSYLAARDAHPEA